MSNNLIVQKTKTEVLDLIFPKKCVGCQTLGIWICPKCFQQLLQLQHIKKKINFFEIYSVGNYKDKTLQNIINYIKYYGIKDLSKEAGQLLTSLYSSLIIDEVDLISSVPLANKRLAERTFNQAELIAKSLSKIINVEYLDLLTRIKESESQTHLSDKERKENVKGIFQVKNKNQSQIIGQKILLVDDVATSGATICEARKILIKAGAQKVIGLTLASR